MTVLVCLEGSLPQVVDHEFSDRILPVGDALPLFGVLVDSFDPGMFFPLVLRYIWFRF